MTRKKVTLAYIANDSERRASYKKRKTGLIKKVSELSTLCGVEACAIVYSPYEQEPIVWPSHPGALSVLAQFHNLSQMEQTRKMFNQEDFTRHRIKKIDDKFSRLTKENKNTEMENFMYQCIAGVNSLENFNFKDAASMRFVIDQTQRDIKSRLEAMDKGNPNHQYRASDSGSASGSVFASASGMVVPGANVDAPLANQMVTSGEEDMESFAWPSMEGITSGMLNVGIGWDEVLPYSSNFNNCDLIPPTSGASHGPGFDAN